MWFAGLKLSNWQVFRFVCVFYLEFLFQILTTTIFICEIMLWDLNCVTYGQISIIELSVRNNSNFKMVEIGQNGFYELAADLSCKLTSIDWLGSVGG